MTNPLEALAAAARSAAPETLILVDAISGLGAVPFETDRWDLDVVVTGSQKAWMVPPGLAMVAVSPRGWAAAEQARMPRFYFDLRAHLESGDKGETPWTPAVGICFGLDVALETLEAEGYDAVFARHAPAAPPPRRLHRPRLQAPGRSGPRLEHRHRGLAAGGRRLVRAQRRPRARPRARRRPGQADRADPPRRPPGSVTVDDVLPRSPSSRPRASTSGCPSPGAVRRWPPPRARRRRDHARPGVRILVAEPLADEGLALLRAEHEVDVRTGLDRDGVPAALPDYDALLVRSQVQVDAEAIAAGRRLLVIGRAGVGVDNIDLAAATAAGIIVVNAPTGNTIAAAEHTLGLMYALARRIAAADASMRRGEWKRSQFTGVELRGKTLGIIGLGKIGMAVADRARAMEMEVIGHDPFVTREAAAPTA